MYEMVDKICSLEKRLLDYIDSEFSMGIQCLAEGNNVEIAGEIIDMIKDLADAKKNCYEAEYYETVTEAMDEYGEEEEGRAGYNNRRYANGRYAPSGRGSRMGYRPMPLYMMDNMMPRERDDRWGYTPSTGNVGNMNYSGNLTGSTGNSGRSGYYYDDRMMPAEPSEHGRHYDNYKMAKRYYTETRSEEDKKRMREHADEYVNNTVAAILEIWNSADPEQKRHIKNNMTPLINGMNS